MAIAGVDVGTTGCKCTVYSNDGKLLGEAYREYTEDMDFGRELDPAMVWEKVKCVLKEAAGGNKEITALSVTSFGEAAVLLDEWDRPVTRTIMYTDSRGEDQCAQLVERLGRSFLSQVTGLNPHSNFSVSKLMWIRQNLPEAWEKTAHIFLYSDYIVHMLCGSNYMDFSLAARTMMFDLEMEDWNPQILEAAGVEKEKLPFPVPTGTPAGKIKKKLAEELNVSEHINIVMGCHDQIAAAVGTGVFQEGTAVDGAGTVECVTPLFKGRGDTEKLLRGNYAVVPYIVPDYRVSYAYSFTGGALLKWYRDKIGLLQAREAKKQEISAYDYFNRSLKEEPSGLLVLPYFAGAATPYMDSSATGAITGLTLETTSEEIYQALMEAVAFEMRLNIENLEDAGISIRQLRASGGGARSPQWLQMKADILNLPIISLGAAQAGTLGCVMMAGVYSGLYRDFQEASEIFLKEQGRYEPRPEIHQAYESSYARYQNLYARLKPVM